MGLDSRTIVVRVNIKKHAGKNMTVNMDGAFGKEDKKMTEQLHLKDSKTFRMIHFFVDSTGQRFSFSTFISTNTCTCHAFV